MFIEIVYEYSFEEGVDLFKCWILKKKCFKDYKVK